MSLYIIRAPDGSISLGKLIAKVAREKKRKCYGIRTAPNPILTLNPITIGAVLILAEDAHQHDGR